MKKQLSILAIFAAILLAALAASPVAANNGNGNGNGNGRGEIIGVTGIVPGQDLIVHILALVPPGADRNEVAQQVLANQGARSLTKQEFSEIDLTWDQFFDGTDSPTVIQNYNSANQPAEVSATQLTTTQGKWSQGTWTIPLAATSSFRFEDGGSTSRCPSLVKECKGKQKFDGNNDVGWLPLRNANTLGVTWSGTTTDEADMALNTNFNWAVDGGAGNFDVETVFLHENGHVLGLGHSADITAVMYPSYQGVLRDLTADEIDGVSSKYPAAGPAALAVTSTSLADGTVDTAYNATLTATGGTGSYIWSITSGSLPGGLIFGGDTISGTPTTIETQVFTIEVTDGASNSASASVSINVPVAPVAGTGVTVTGVDHTLNGGKGGDKDLRVTVNVADDQGNPVEGASVSIILRNDDSGGPWFGTASTGADGSVSFRLRNAPAGCYSTEVDNVTAAGLTWDKVSGPFGGDVCKLPSSNKSGGNSGALQAE